MKLLTFRPPRARIGHFGALLKDNRVLDITALHHVDELPFSE